MTPEDRLPLHVVVHAMTDEQALIIGGMCLVAAAVFIGYVVWLDRSAEKRLRRKLDRARAKHLKNDPG